MLGRNDPLGDARLSSGSLAQSVEQKTFNLLVEGSNPSRPTTYWQPVSKKRSMLLVEGSNPSRPTTYWQLVSKKRSMLLVEGSNPSRSTTYWQPVSKKRSMLLVEGSNPYRFSRRSSVSREKTCDIASAVGASPAGDNAATASNTAQHHSSCTPLRRHAFTHRPTLC
jgi:hypothetical protein